jgi:DNA-binding transcriptional ArsR family regulator
MQLELVRRLIRMLIERIVRETFPGETGAARLQQLGLFVLIFAYESEAEPVTATLLSELTGQSRNRVYKQLEKLDEVGIIQKTEILSKHGRGRTYKLTIKHNEKTKRLLEAIGDSVPTKAKISRKGR